MARIRKQTDFYSPDWVPDRSFKPVNWRQQGRVVTASNQGTCGCCWAFSAAANIASKMAILSKKHPVKLSAQNIIDCCHRVGCTPCAGGSVYQALCFVQENGIYSDQDYGYVSEFDPINSERRPCRQEELSNSEIFSVVSVKNIRNRRMVNFDIVYEALLGGPVSVTIDSYQLFNEYEKYSIWTQKQDVLKHLVNHSILLTGVDIDDEGKYYFHALNSWGGEWGDDGFFKIRAGECGMYFNLTYFLTCYI